jgi:hypothetical protein
VVVVIIIIVVFFCIFRLQGGPPVVVSTFELGGGGLTPKYSSIIYIYKKRERYIYIHKYQPFASVSQLPAALRPPQKKHAPGFRSMFFSYVIDFN